MNLTTMFYICSLLENLNVVLVSIILTLATFLATYFAISAADGKFKYLTHIKKACVALIIITIVSIFIPNKTMLYSMLGSEVTQKILKDPEIVKINDKLIKIISEKLDELEPKKNGK